MTNQEDSFVRSRDVRKGQERRRRKEGVTHGEEGNVKDHEVKSHGEDDASDEVGVSPERENEKRFVLGERVAGVEHLDDCTSRKEHGRRPT
jgi:hypothetical protein